MLTLPYTTSEAAAGSDVTLQARIVAANGTGTAVTNEGNAIKQADCSSISCIIQDRSSATPDTTVATPTITVAGAISDTLLADNIWSKNDVAIDSIGRNFTHQVPGSNFATANHRYRVKYQIVLTDGTTMKWWHDHLAK